MARVAKSLDAERDLSDLFDYIARESGVDRAEMVLRRIGTIVEYPVGVAVDRPHSRRIGRTSSYVFNLALDRHLRAGTGG